MPPGGEANPLVGGHAEVQQRDWPDHRVNDGREQEVFQRRLPQISRNAGAQACIGLLGLLFEHRLAVGQAVAKPGPIGGEFRFDVGFDVMDLGEQAVEFGVHGCSPPVAYGNAACDRAPRGGHSNDGRQAAALSPRSETGRRRLARFGTDGSEKSVRSPTRVCVGRRASSSAISCSERAAARARLSGESLAFIVACDTLMALVPLISFNLATGVWAVWRAVPDRP